MKKNILLLCGAVGSAVIIVWIVAEIAVRSMVPYWDLSMALQYSPSLFSQHVIARKTQTVYRRTDPSDTLYINSLGYRGNSFSMDKPSDQIRIMVYGGSQVFSAGTGRMSWPEWIEKNLEGKGYKNIEVINAGTPGHASFDSLGRLFSFGHYLDPDIVILVNQWNDLKYFHLKAPLTKAKPYNPQRNPRRNYLNSIDRFFGQHSQFYLLLRELFFNWGTNPRRQDDFYRPGEHSKISSQALRQYNLNVKTFVDVVLTLGAKPVLLKQPRLLTENISEKQRKKIRYEVQNLTPEAILKGFRLTDRTLEKLANYPQVYLIEPAGMNGKGKYFYDHVHLTPKGAKVLAERVSRSLVNDVLKTEG